MQTIEQPTHSRMTIAHLSFQQHTVYCEGSIAFHVHNVYESAFKKSGRYACCQQKRALAGECIVEYYKADEPSRQAFQTIESGVMHASDRD
jgi:hypothetical protein